MPRCDLRVRVGETAGPWWQGGAADQDRCRWFVGARWRDRVARRCVRHDAIHTSCLDVPTFHGCEGACGRRPNPRWDGPGLTGGPLASQKKSKKGKKEKRSKSDAPSKAAKAKRRKKEKKSRQSSSSSSDSSSDSDGSSKRLTPEVRLTMGRLAVQVQTPGPSRLLWSRQGFPTALHRLQCFHYLISRQVGGLSIFHCLTHYARTSHPRVVVLASTSARTRAWATAVRWLSGRPQPRSALAIKARRGGLRRSQTHHRRLGLLA